MMYLSKVDMIPKNLTDLTESGYRLFQAQQFFDPAKVFSDKALAVRNSR